MPHLAMSSCSCMPKDTNSGLAETGGSDIDVSNTISIAPTTVPADILCIFDFVVFQKQANLKMKKKAHSSLLFFCFTLFCAYDG